MSASNSNAMSDNVTGIRHGVYVVQSRLPRTDLRTIPDSPPNFRARKPGMTLVTHWPAAPPLARPLPCDTGESRMGTMTAARIAATEAIKDRFGTHAVE